MTAIETLRPCLLAALLTGAFPLPAQQLHQALSMADAVAVGRQVGKREANPELVLHRLQVLHAVRGIDAPAITVLDWPNLSLHNRPIPRQSRLYCLIDARATAERLGLPAAEGPYFRMVGHPGSCPLVGADIARDPVVRLARLLAESERGRAPADTAVDLFGMALGPDVPVRTEATALLAARAELRAGLSDVHWSQLVGRAAGETDDVAYKIALSELCAEQRIDGLLEALVVSVGPVPSPEYARTVGRIATYLHGERGATPLTERLQMAREPQTRAMLLLALGASNTESALQTLLQIRRASGADPALDAALREHRSPRALEAAARTGR
jgi:hypothetical protein